MNGILTIDLPRIYGKKQVLEFEIGYHRTEEIIEKISYQLRIQKLAEKGLVRLATGRKMEVGIPPRFPGKPLSEYLKEIRE